MRIIGKLAVLFAVLAGSGCDRPADTPEGGAPEMALETDLVLGAGNTSPAYEFGRVAGIAVDNSGRLVIADNHADVIRVFGPNGDFQYEFGRNGAGPGEMSGACCLAFDREGHLWVRDGGNARYDIFELGAMEARPLRTVRMAHSDVNRWAPVTFDEGGNVIDIGTRTDPATQVSGTVRFHLDSASAVVRTEAVHKVPDDSTAMKKVQRQMGDGTMTLFAYQPYGPMELTAHGANGDFANALSSRYEIDWRDARGALVRHIKHPIAEGPALSAAERASAEESLEKTAKRLNVSRSALGFDIPTNKPVLYDLLFDQAGNLWVTVATADGAPRQAHVWSRDGRLMRKVSWPTDVSLRSAIIGDRNVWALTTDSLDVERPVRLKFSEMK